MERVHPVVESLAHSSGPGSAVPGGVGPSRVPIGRGRSGVVYLERSPGRPPRAVKVFVGDPAGDLVHLILGGAPNPYRWNGDAVAAAYHRRRIVAVLARLWFGDRLRVAMPRQVRWNPDDRAWELHADFVDGRPAGLRHPLSKPRDDEQDDLVHGIMRPLQRRLREAGLHGLVWQAGLGNPVATANFLRDATVPNRWHWIDLESGVPAVAAIDPRAVFGFYLPHGWRRGRPLFDDVDVAQLRDYLARRRREIGNILDPIERRRLRGDVDALERHQRAWHSPGRLERGITAAVAVGKLTAHEASRYRNRPGLWTLRQARMTLASGWRGACRATRRLRRRLAAFQPLRSAREATRFLLSARRRERVGRRWILERVRAWRRRGQMEPGTAGFLRRQARGCDDGRDLTDFTVHLALKTVYKPITWALIPILVHLGWLDALWLPLALLLGGSVTRTAYTSSRAVEAVLRGRRPPWLALAWGTLPVVGTAAFPVQILARGAGRDRAILAGFLVYDLFTALGRRIPIWGGPDTLTEFRANRLAHLLAGSRSALVIPVTYEPSSRSDAEAVRR